MYLADRLSFVILDQFQDWVRGNGSHKMIYLSRLDRVGVRGTLYQI